MMNKYDDWMNHKSALRPCCKASSEQSGSATIHWIIWSSIKVHLVDALAAEGDEGRCSLRYASGSRQTDFDPGISEWGNPPLRRYLHLNT